MPCGRRPVASLDCKNLEKDIQMKKSDRIIDLKKKLRVMTDRRGAERLRKEELIEKLGNERERWDCKHEDLNMKIEEFERKVKSLEYCLLLKDDTIKRLKEQAKTVYQVVGLIGCAKRVERAVRRASEKLHQNLDFPLSRELLACANDLAREIENAK
jgi:ribosomal protein L17